MNEMTIRLERKEDRRAVEELTREAFWNLHGPGCDEHYLVHILRSHPDFLPELNFIAEREGRIVGHIMGSRSWVKSGEGQCWDTVTFGPLSVLPECQNQGVGGALLKCGLERARAMEERAVIIYGSPEYYKRFGFDHAKRYGIQNPEGKYPIAHLALPLCDGGLEGVSGRAYESSAFDMDRRNVEAFDAAFPPKAKENLPAHQDFMRTVHTYL